MPLSTREKGTKEFEFTQKQFDTLRKKAKAYAGIHVTEDKYEMFYARLAKKIRQLKLNNFSEYLSLLDKDQSEFKNFINAITTNVTSFGREQHHFDYLQEMVRSGKKTSLSIWSAGCSSGEEPYSIILNLYELCQRHRVRLTILATDLDTDVLRKAANGVYPLQAIEKYPKNLKKTFFLKGKGSNEGFCRVKKQFRQLIEFRQLNLISDWKFPTPFDAIFCRNVMIYFDNEQKAEILRKYHESLCSKGLLFLGHSESLHKLSKGFDNVGKTIYEKT